MFRGMRRVIHESRIRRSGSKKRRSGSKRVRIERSK